MHEALLVRRFERFGDLPRDGERLGERDGPAGDEGGQVMALDELHHERDDAVVLFEAVNVGDVGVVQRRKRLRFTSESRQTIRVAPRDRRAGP